MIRDTSAQDQVLRPATPKHRKLLWVAVAIGALLLSMLAWSTTSRWLAGEVSVPRDRLRTAPVQRGDFVRDVGVQGRIVAAVSPTLYSPTGGAVTLEVQPGDEVAEGQVLAEIDSPELRAEAQQAQSTLDSLQAELERQRIEVRKAKVRSQQVIDLAEVTLTAARREMRRAEKSMEIQAISEIDFERTRDELQTAEVEYAHARQDAELESESLAFELTTRELEVERQSSVSTELQRRLEALQVRSPVGGIVGNVAVTQKAVVAANQPLITVVDLSAFEVEVAIPESYADDLGLGMLTEIQYGNEAWRGQLVALSPEVINSEVVGRIRFDGETPPGLRQSQRVTARIIIDQLDNTLKLRRGAFADGAGSSVFVLGDDGMAVRRPVQLGSRSVSEIQVVDGLSEGEMVVISNVAEFRDVDTLRVVD